MNHRLLAPMLASLVAVSGAAQAGTVLLPTLTAPTELQLGQHDEYTLSVTNTGNVIGSNVVLRMPFPSGLVLAQAPTGCSVISNEPLGGSGPNTRQVKCLVGGLGIGVTKSYWMVVRAPTQPRLVQHRNWASASNAASAQSVITTTDYRHYDVTVPPGSTWQRTLCSGYAPIDFDICPPGSIQGPVTLDLLAGGQVARGGQVSSIMAWSQATAHDLRVDWYRPVAPFADVMQALNSRCFRGTIEQTSTIYTVVRYCRT
ncbi:hypothetical protein [Ideonella alba]|uniref:DUF11 domain-containing protein n=1 Tax=Ideonella alba TaxID=2824118 RepID=A0A940Y9K3_9BURK|nr:hypothetical protein [Ideonella alba]MBQ0930685.1 hypothetical protein [Ideonella alba]